MTRVIYNTATTLTGFIADENDSLEWLFSVEQSGGDELDEFLPGIGVLVTGSTTYEWVLREADLMSKPQQWQQFYGDRPTYVFTSRELPVPAGADVRFRSGAVTDALGDIREAADGRDVWVVGGGDLAGQFYDADALDEIRLSIAPATLVRGAPLFPRRLDSSKLRLTSVGQRGQFAELTYAVQRS